jgi:hypothetical protein
MVSRLAENWRGFSKKTARHGSTTRDRCEGSRGDTYPREHGGRSKGGQVLIDPMSNSNKEFFVVHVT